MNLQPISDVVIAERTYSASEVLAITQQWNDTAVQLGVLCLIIGFAIGYFGPMVGKYLKDKYGSSE